MTDKQVNLHPKNDSGTNLKPNIISENIPDKAVTLEKLDQNIQNTISNHSFQIAKNTADITKNTEDIDKNTADITNIIVNMLNGITYIHGYTKNGLTNSIVVMANDDTVLISANGLTITNGVAVLDDNAVTESGDTITITY